MLTTSHWLIWFLIFRKKEKKIISWWIFGSIFPDIPMYISFVLLFISSYILWIWEINHEALHGQIIDRILSPVVHSFLFWVNILLLCFILRKNIYIEQLKAFSIGWFSHIFIDLLTHKGDWTWNHFYPMNFKPIEWFFYYLNPYFFAIEHFIFIIIFTLIYIKKRKIKMDKKL